MSNKQIHPNVWNQLSPVQQWNKVIENDMEVRHEGDNFFTVRGCFVTSPHCPTKERAIELDFKFLKLLRKQAENYNNSDSPY